MKLRTLALFAVLAVSALAVPRLGSGQTPLYSIININPAGATYAAATGVNDDYQVVGIDGAKKGFLWMPGVPSFHFDSGLYTFAAGINDLGQIVGDGYNATDGYPGNATIWSPTSYLSTTYTKTVDLSGTGTYGSEFTAINLYGDAVGRISTSDTSSSALEWFGSPYAISEPYYPYAVNSAFAASCGYGAGAAWSLLLYYGAPPVALAGGTFGGLTYASGNSVAFGLDEANDVVGYDYLPVAGAAEPFAWDGVTGTAYGPLGNLPHSSSGEALAINTPTGDVVGYSGVRAFLWTGDITNPSAGTMTDLNSLVETNSGWRLVRAFGLNDYGAIVGTGYYQQKEAAFLAIPVIISSLTTAAPSVVGGSTIAGTVTLDAPAPFDMSVTVTTYNAKVNFGAGIYTTSVVIYSGDTSASFHANTSTVTTPTDVTLKATFGGWRRYTHLVVTP